MIFYFSGTGNSQWVAGRIGDILKDTAVSVSGELAKRPEGDLVYGPEGCRRAVFVFPVHSWGPAVMMLRFISRLVLNGCEKVYAVCTCGDNCGETDKILSSALRRRGIRLDACWSVRMPNNYILMKGFGVDDRQVEEEKLAAAPAAVDAIASAIMDGSDYSHYVAGNNVFVKSRIVNPLFRLFLAGPESRTRFTVSDACIGCGKCAADCPAGVIVMKDSRPVWGRGCVQCTACINRCPARAIEYGNVSQSQGRYCHPSLR